MPNPETALLCNGSRPTQLTKTFRQFAQPSRSLTVLKRPICPLDHLFEPAEAHGLAQEIERSRLECLERKLWVGRHQSDERWFPRIGQTANRLDHVEAVNLGHLDVEDC